MRVFSLFAAIICYFAALSCAPVAHAQILLKPNGQNAAPLRVKSLDAQVKIQGQFAQTSLTYVFQNETSERVEADFFYTVPNHATVTYFAYWFGEEKVVARVVEKERAAQIYQYITSRMRDPALVEMVGKNTFRARIFPVMPNADLKVEIHTVQVLPSHSKGAFYTLPLRGPQEGKGTFENLNVNIQGVLDSAFSAVSNNFGQPMTIDSNRFRYQLHQQNYLAPRDLEIVLKPRQSKLRAVVYARRAGGDDGFFALALAPSSALKNPQIAFSGVKTYDIAPQKLPSVAANGTLLITGRYKGSGFATTVLRDGKRQWKTLVQLSGAVEANNLASKLWAARRIEDLSANSKNKNAVMALSQRFTLPSKWTSWLAIPKAEIERYKQEKARADMDYYGRLLAVEMAEGRGKGSRAKELRTRFEDAAKLIGYSSEGTLTDWAQRRLNDMSYNYEYANGPQKAQMKAEMRGLARLANVNVNDYYNRHAGEAARQRAYQKREAQLNGIGQQLARELMKNGDTSRAKSLNSRLQTMSRAQGRWAPSYVQNHLYSQMQGLGKELVQQKMQGKPDAKRVTQIEWRLNLLTKYTGTGVDYWTADAERQIAGDGIYSEARELINLRHSEAPDKARLAALEAKFARFTGRLHYVDDTLNNAKTHWAHDEMHRAATLLAQENGKDSPDKARLAELQKQFSQALNETPDVPKDAAQKQFFVQHFHDLARSTVLNEGLNSVSDSLHATDAERGAQMKQGRQVYARLHRKFLQGEPNPLESSEMRGLLDEAERQKEPLSTEQRREIYQAMNGFMRWGDPLISIEAPADAVQVIALLPNGEIKKLVWNGTKWQARFDIPTHAKEGDFPITVIIVNKSGTRRQIALHFKVDVTAPQGKGTVQRANEKLRLDLVADADTTRVGALLPWSQKVELTASTQNSNRFFALADVPAEWRGKAAQITYVLTDKAHNRTTISVDMKH